MTTKTNTKQTAANNTFLANVKRDWNTKIYKHTLALVNTQGEDAARAYLQTFTTATLNY
jgi:hypothetical protein